MAQFLKSLLGNSAKLTELTPELREILSQMQQEREAFESLVLRAQGSVQQLEQLSDPIAQAQSKVTSITDRLGSVSAQMAAVEKLVPQLASVQEQAESIAHTQRRAEKQIEHTTTDAERVRLQLEDIKASVDESLALKDRIGEFLELGSPFAAMQEEAKTLGGQLRNFGEELGRAHGKHEELGRATEAASSRLDAFQEQFTAMQAGVDTAASRVATLESAMETVSQVASGAQDTKRQLSTLKALTDYVGQKIAALEQQREAVDKATRQAANLTELIRRIDAETQKQQGNAAAVAEYRAKLDDLQSMHAKVLERSEEISVQQEQVEQEEQRTRATLASVRQDVQKSLERFDMENRSLDSVTQRIVDLRGSLTDFEERFRTLEESRHVLSVVRSTADNLSVQVEGIASEVDRLQTHSDKVQSVRTDLDRIDQLLQDASSRAFRVEESRPAVEAALRDLSTLSGSHETVRDAIDQIRGAHAEFVRFREGQAETEAWLATVQEAIGSLRNKVQEVHGMKPTVDMVRSEVDRVSQSMASIESRREFLEDMHSRLSDLASTGAQLDERSKGLLSRMEAADERFVGLSLHADEAERVEKLMPSVVKHVEEAEQRLADVDESMTSLEGRAQNLEGLSDRVRHLGEELDQRQRALDKASEHLKRAAEVRQEAATTAQQLDEQTRKLSAALGTAERRANRLDEMSQSLEDRSSNLRFAEKRMAQFEEQLAKWQLVEQQLGRSLDQIGERQATVDALQADIKHMFEMAERTVEDVRSIADAQQEVLKTKAQLEDVLIKLREVDDRSDELELRKQQIARVEDRIARADALVIDIQSSLEMLNSQKAFLDHVIEKAGSLTFQSKQAEVLIDTLRDERELTNKIRTAASDMRDQGHAKAS